MNALTYTLADGFGAKTSFWRLITDITNASSAVLGLLLSLWSWSWSWLFCLYRLSFTLLRVIVTLVRSESTHDSHAMVRRLLESVD